MFNDNTICLQQTLKIINDSISNGNVDLIKCDMCYQRGLALNSRINILSRYLKFISKFKCKIYNHPHPGFY